MKLAVESISYHPLSFADSSGRLFWHEGELYRSISPERTPFYQELFARGIVQQLVERRLLVETEPADLEIEGAGMVVRHRRIPFVSYPPEWCAAMLKAAAETVLDLQETLFRHQLRLRDAHPWNVLFDGPIPCYVDFGSIIPDEGGPVSSLTREFRQFFVNPLRAMGNGQARIARWLLHDFDRGVSEAEASVLAGANHRPGNGSDRSFGLSFLRNNIRRERRSPSDPLQELRVELDAISVVQPRTCWSDYYENEFPPFEPSDQWTPKHRSMDEILADCRPRSLLDIGSNRGWYAQLAACRGVPVVAMDVDESSVTRLYDDARQAGMPILPLLMDIRSPSPGYGLCNEWFPPAVQRLRCEMVMALALVHHLVFKQRLRFEQIVAALDAFSGRWLLVEFIGREDRYVREWWNPQRHGWYTLEHFESALRKHYANIRRFPSNLEHRVLLLCEKQGR